MKRHYVKRDIAPSAGFIDIYVRRQTCEEKAENITHPTQSDCDVSCLSQATEP